MLHMTLLLIHAYIFILCIYIHIYIHIHIYPYTHMDMYVLCKTTVVYYPILQINIERAKTSMEISRLL